MLFKLQTPPLTPPLKGRGRATARGAAADTAASAAADTAANAAADTAASAAALPSLQGEGLGVGSVTSNYANRINLLFIIT